MGWQRSGQVGKQAEAGVFLLRRLQQGRGASELSASTVARLPVRTRRHRRLGQQHRS